MRSYPGMRDIPWQLRGTYNAVFCLEHYFPKSELVQSIKATSRKRILEHVRRSGKGRLLQVARATSLTPDLQDRPSGARSAPHHAKVVAIRSMRRATVSAPLR